MREKLAKWIYNFTECDKISNVNLHLNRMFFNDVHVVCSILTADNVV
jgi:hypothetical protein